MDQCQGVSPKPRLPESLVRGFGALLATPFLLLAALGVALWVIAAYKRRAETARRRSRPALRSYRRVSPTHWTSSKL